MDFKPFDPPPTDHHPLATGHTTEGGVSAKGFVEGVNEAFQHLFGTIGGKKSDDADRIAELEEAVAALQKRDDDREGNVKALLTSFDTLTGHVNHIESAASDTAFKADALERRFNDMSETAAAVKTT